MCSDWRTRSGSRLKARDCITIIDLHSTSTKEYTLFRKFAQTQTLVDQVNTVLLLKVNSFLFL